MIGGETHQFGVPERLWLVRHGQSTGNVAHAQAAAVAAERLELGTRDADVPLSGLGREQAGTLGLWLASLAPGSQPTAVLCSPYLRAAQTAAVALAACGGAVGELPVRADERLRDRDLGVFEGLTWRGVQATHPELAAARLRVGKFYFRPPGGESWTDVLLRLRSVEQTLLHEYAGERVLIVSHDVVVLLFRYLYDARDEQETLRLGIEEPVANGCVTAFARDGQCLRLESYNRSPQAGGPAG